MYISELIRFARVCSYVDDLNARNECLRAKLLKQDYRCHKPRKVFSNYYRRHYELVSKFNVRLKSLLHQNQNFMVTLWYTNSKRLWVGLIFSDQFRKVIIRHKRIGYNLKVVLQYAC